MKKKSWVQVVEQSDEHVYFYREEQKKRKKNPSVVCLLRVVTKTRTSEAFRV